MSEHPNMPFCTKLHLVGLGAPVRAIALPRHLAASQRFRSWLISNGRNFFVENVYETACRRLQQRVRAFECVLEVGAAAARYSRTPSAVKDPRDAPRVRTLCLTGSITTTSESEGAAISLALSWSGDV
jgi:hypothetical protein